MASKQDLADLVGGVGGGGGGPADGAGAAVPGPRAGGAAAAAAAKKAQLGGLSKEARALLDHQSQHPMAAAALTSLVGAHGGPLGGGGGKKKKKLGSSERTTRGLIKWEHKAFANPARSDGLQLRHWERTSGEGGRLGTMGTDGRYVFAKYDQKIDVVRYDAEEYAALLAGDEASAGWSKAETDYLFDLCERFDLRFFVVGDRYAFPGGPPGGRSLEDLKHRYYSVARKLLVARKGSETAVAHEPLMQVRAAAAPAGERRFETDGGLDRGPFRSQCRYNLNAEKDRRHALGILLRRSARQVREDEAVLREAAEIEARRKAASGANLPSLSAAGALLGDHGLGLGGADGVVGLYERQGPSWAAALKNSMEVAPTGAAYGRGAYVRRASEKAINSVPGGQRAQKLIESALAELGVPGLVCATHKASVAWYNLRADVIALLELKKQVTARQQVSCTHSDCLWGTPLFAAGVSSCAKRAWPRCLRPRWTEPRRPTPLHNRDFVN